MRGDEPADQQIELQEEEQPEQDLHAAEIMLRRVHTNLGHPSKGLMLCLLRDASAPLEMLIAARNLQEQSDLCKCLGARNLATPFQLMRVTGNETEMDVKQSS